MLLLSSDRFALLLLDTCIAGCSFLLYCFPRTSPCLGRSPLVSLPAVGSALVLPAVGSALVLPAVGCALLPAVGCALLGSFHPFSPSRR